MLDRVLLFKFFLQEASIIHDKHEKFLKAVHYHGSVEYVKYLIYCYYMKQFYKNVFVCKTIQSHCSIGVAYDLAVISQEMNKWNTFKFERFVYRMEKWKGASMFMDFHRKAILKIPANIAEDDYVESDEVKEFYTLYPNGGEFEYVSKLRVKYITLIDPTESKFKQYE